MNTKVWFKIGKVASVVLPLAAGVISSFVNAHESKQTVIETTEKLVKEHLENK